MRRPRCSWHISHLATRLLLSTCCRNCRRADNAGGKMLTATVHAEMARWWKTVGPYIRDDDGNLLPPELQAAAPHIGGEASIG